MKKLYTKSFLIKVVSLISMETVTLTNWWYINVLAYALFYRINIKQLLISFSTILILEFKYISMGVWRKIGVYQLVSKYSVKSQI